MKRRIAVLALLILIAGTALTEERSEYGFESRTFEVNVPSDTALLPLLLEEPVGSARQECRHPIIRSLCVVNPSILPNEICTVATAQNGYSYEHDPATFTLRQMPAYTNEKDRAVWLTVTDFRLARDSLDDSWSVLAFGSRADTAYAIWLDFFTDSTFELYLASDENQTGGDEWSPRIEVIGEFDYDDDGKIEFLVFLDPERSATRGRTLFSIEPATRRIEWSLPVASLVSSVFSLSNCDSDGAKGIIFDAHNQFQGNSDSTFRDSFGYVAVVDDSGKLLKVQVGSVEAGGFGLAESNETGYYLLHDIVLSDPRYIHGLSESVLRSFEDNVYYLSKLDCMAEVQHSITLDKRPIMLWVQDSLFGESEVIFMFYESRHVRAYSPSLELIGESSSYGVREYIGEYRIGGYGRVFIFSEGIYSEDFEMLCAFPYHASFAEPVQFDSLGNLTKLAIGGGSGYTLARIGERTFWDRMAILYFDYKIYIIGISAGLATALLVTLVYNRRLHGSRMRIARQKRQLEEAHEKLREAQAQIISQKLLKQARDIAGGFAHAIRNALFPARTVVARLSSSDYKDMDPAKRQHLLDLLEESIVRGIKLTQLISEYARLENAKNPQAVDLAECVDSALESLRLRILELGVQIENKVDDYKVISNRDQLEMCIANILSNSLDALAETVDPTIGIETSPDGSEVILAVIDNGPGIDLDDPSRVFDVFYSTKPNRGLGIGLSTAKLIVEMYDGSISVKSDPGMRTEFQIKLKQSDNTYEKHDYPV